VWACDDGVYVCFWLWCVLGCVGSTPGLQAVYRPLRFDRETEEFLKSCKPGWWAHLLARLLHCCFSVTDTNGILGRELAAPDHCLPPAAGLALPQSTAACPWPQFDVDFLCAA
jgi:hypothetical protein